jgi:hypothetical protein
MGEVAMGFGVVRKERQGLVVMRPSPVEPPHPEPGIGEIVMGFRVLGFQHRHPFEAGGAFLELAHLLQDDAEIVPGADEVGLSDVADRPARSASSSRPFCRHISAKLLK